MNLGCQWIIVLLKFSLEKAKEKHVIVHQVTKAKSRSDNVNPRNSKRLKVIDSGVSPTYTTDQCCECFLIYEDDVR